MTQSASHNTLELFASVQRWIDDDPDQHTREELSTLLGLAQAPHPLDTEAEQASSAALRELTDRFAGLLKFGTAGLRGAIGAGPNRMNRAVVIRAAAGLVAFLKDSLADQVRAGTLSVHTAEGTRPPRIVIGYDARHRSHDFAIDSAGVAIAAGCEVHVFSSALPTPLLAFATRELQADAGIMVTASHNPPQDNGYKVYLGGRIITNAGQGAQLVDPMDGEIAARIGAISSVRDVPRSTEGWQIIPSALTDDYVTAAAGDISEIPGPLRIVRTALHGVGGATAQRVLNTAGFSDVRPVPEQEEPDPDFPTVSFPNPEEPGAIDLALKLAQAENADLVIANDPDADRCAVAIKDPLASPETGGWRMLHGDEVGVLLGQWTAQRQQTLGNAGVLANSIVSSRLLAKIAAAHGLEHQATLTGFKWISRVEGLVYGYEEALGYCVDPARVRDKDGMSAAAMIAKLAAQLKADGSDLAQHLDGLARTYGLHLTDQLSARFTNLAHIGAAVNSLRATPPEHLGGSKVLSTVDLARGTSELPPTDALVITTADDTRVVVRPSGTEPKLKCYLEVIHPVAEDESVARIRLVAREHLTAIMTDLREILGLK